MDKSELEKENKRLKEELFALNRNFEALCSKLKEDKNLIKRLEDELLLSKNKIAKDELVTEVKNYKEKYEQLANSISIIEAKYHNSAQNCKKYQENEAKYKSYINKLEEKVKYKDKLESQNLQLKKQNEQQSIFLLEENKKLEAENKKLIQKNEEISKKAQETNQIYAQMKKENELIYKLLEETREKLKKNDQIISELSKQMKNKQEDRYKQLYSDTIKGYNTLKEQYKALLQENDKKQNTIVHSFNNNQITNEQFNFLKKGIDNDEKFAEFNKKIIEGFNGLCFKYETFLLNKIQQFDIKIEKYQNDTKNKISLLLTRKNSKLSDEKSEFTELQDKLLKSQLKISSLDSSIKQHEQKIQKIKLKKQQLKKENETLTKNISLIRENQKNFVDISEIKELFKQINEIFERLKLTMETFQINLNCKHCFEIKNKLIQLTCGHSLCDSCFKVENCCIECEKKIEKNLCYDNLYSNNVIVRYKYAQQQIESDIDLVITTLKNYFESKN